MSENDKKRFKVKVFRFETRSGEVVCRYMLTDNLIPMLVPNQYIEAKSVNKLGTGKNHANKLAAFFNYLCDNYCIGYESATNKHVNNFLSFLVYGDMQDLKLIHPQESLCYSTLSGYVGAITKFYLWLDQNYGSEMYFYDCENKRRTYNSYLYGQNYTNKYKKIIDRMLPDTKCGREYVKWYDDKEKKLLISNFLTLRDKAVFLLTLEGFRIDEVLSIYLSGYNPIDKIIQPTRSKRRQTAVKGGKNELRTVRISDETCEAINRYIFEERTPAENKSGIISDVMFLNIKNDENIGKPHAYHNYRSVLRGCARRAGLDESKIRTHSGRSTKVMDMLEEGALNPKKKKSDLELMLSFGWSSINSIMPYINHNSEIMANASYERRNKAGGDTDD